MNHRHYPSLFKLLVGLSIGLLALACSTTDNGLSKQADNTQQKKLVVKRGAYFSWGRIIFFDAPRFRGSDVNTILNDAIIETLAGKALHYTEKSTDSNYLVSYTIILGNTLDEKALKALYEQDPALKAAEFDPSRYESGSFIIKLLDSKTHTEIWSHTVAGVAGFDIPNNVRVKRTRSLVQTAFSTFPDTVE